MCVEGPVFLFYFQSIVELYFVKYNKNTLPKKKKKLKERYQIRALIFMIILNKHKINSVRLL